MMKTNTTYNTQRTIYGFKPSKQNDLHQTLLNRGFV